MTSPTDGPTPRAAPAAPRPPAARSDALRVEAVERRERHCAQTSHEMLNVVAGLSGYVEILDDAREPGADSRAREHDGAVLDRIKVLTDRLARLGQDLLDHDPAPTGPVGLTRVEVVPLRLQPQLVEGADGLPGLDVRVVCPDDLVVLADHLRRQQVLGTLLRNAERHGAPPVSVTALAAPGNRARPSPRRAQLGSITYDSADRAFVLTLPRPSPAGAPDPR